MADLSRGLYSPRKRDGSQVTWNLLRPICGEQMSPEAWGWDVSQGQGRSQENASDGSAEPVAMSVIKMKYLLPTFAASFAGSEKSWKEDEKMKSTCQEDSSLVCDI